MRGQRQSQLRETNAEVPGFRIPGLNRRLRTANRGRPSRPRGSRGRIVPNSGSTRPSLPRSEPAAVHLLVEKRGSPAHISFLRRKRGGWGKSPKEESVGCQPNHRLFFDLSLHSPDHFTTVKRGASLAPGDGSNSVPYSSLCWEIKPNPLHLWKRTRIWG